MQSGVFDLLRGEDAEVRSARWTEISRVILDAIVLAHFRTPGKHIFISDLASTAAEILQERGEVDVDIVPATFGKRLSHLGFAARRDSKGRKLLLSEAAVSRAEKLLHNLKGVTAARPIPNISA